MNSSRSVNHKAMVDCLTQGQRRYCMSRVRGRNTKPEIALRRALWHRGIRYRKTSNLPGRPDIVVPSRSLAIFVDGCFWHYCPEHASIPKSNTDFWRRKIARNVERDREVNAQLTDLGWTVVRIWEHDIVKEVQQVVDRIVAAHFNEKMSMSSARQTASICTR